MKRAKYNPNRNDVYAVDPDQSGGFDIFGARCDYTTDNSMGISVVSRFAFDYTTDKSMGISVVSRFAFGYTTDKSMGISVVSIKSNQINFI